MLLYRASARQVQVTLGDYVVNSATESLPAYTFGVREIRVHPYFKFTPQADRYVFAFQWKRGKCAYLDSPARRRVLNRIRFIDISSFARRSIVYQVRRGGAPIGSTGSLHAPHSADMSTREERGLLGTIRLGCGMGRFASR